MDAFTFKQFLHKIRGSKVMFAGKHAFSVNHPVGRDGRDSRAGSIHGAADHSGRPPGAQERRDCSVGSDPPGWDQAYNVIYTLKKLYIIFYRFQSEPVCTYTGRLSASQARALGPGGVSWTHYLSFFF